MGPNLKRSRERPGQRQNRGQNKGISVNEWVNESKKIPIGKRKQNNFVIVPMDVTGFDMSKKKNKCKLATFKVCFGPLSMQSIK